MALAWKRVKANRGSAAVNQAETALAPAFARKFLGYTLWAGTGGQVKCAVARKALEALKQRIRAMTRRSGGP